MKRETGTSSLPLSALLFLLSSSFSSIFVAGFV
jgi:hypothetical protein